MTGKRSPSRFGIWPELVPRLERAGWISGDRVAESALPLLKAVRSGPDPEGALDRIANALEADPELAARTTIDLEYGLALVAIAGSSRIFGNRVAAESGSLPGPHSLLPDPPVPSAIPAETHKGLRTFVQGSMMRVAVRDLMGFDDLVAIGRSLGELADSAAEVALAAASLEVRTHQRFADLPEIPIAVIAMGKWGGLELNYSSDIDLLFVHGTHEGAGAQLATEYVRRVCGSFISNLSQVTKDGAAYRVDVDLRPEGRSGPLARTVDSYRNYYERWASTWEFQALIKARPAAGDRELGAQFLTMIEPFVYPETLDPAAVREVRAMKGRIEGRAVEQGIEEVEIKRGIGGIRDIEFAVQLLQLVHGRFDESLRSANTLDTLRTLAREGYVGRLDAEDLATAYVWLRTLEHRIQLVDLRQTHMLPEDRAERERLAKSMGYRDRADSPAIDAFESDLISHRSVVRTIHERLFYRPLLEAFAAAPTVSLTEEGVARQLKALGFRDVAGARRAVADLTSGLSRRSKLMQQSLPLLLEWLSRTPDPDLGLEQLRLLVTSTGENTTLVGILRDSPVAAERLCHLLGSSKVAGRYIDRIPRFLPEMADDTRIGQTVDPVAIALDAVNYVMLRPTLDRRFNALRRFVRSAVLRVLARDLLDLAGDRTTARELSDVADAAVKAALAVAQAELGDPRAQLPFAVIAMGRWGGRELDYPSDLDLLFVYEAPPGEDSSKARSTANTLAQTFSAALSKVTPEGIAFKVDTGLRPEGKDGPLARSLEGYRKYYDEWAAVWERQALIRARYAGGNENLGLRFEALAAEHAFADPPSPDTVLEVRKMKARVESERIPPGEDRDFHFKLGRGGLVDIEFLTQLLQMKHGARIERLRSKATLTAVAAATESGLLNPDEGAALEEAYRFCTKARNRLFLQIGRDVGSLPTDPSELSRLALSLGYPGGSVSNLREDYRKLTRRARRVFETRFYEDSPPHGA